MNKICIMSSMAENLITSNGASILFQLIKSENLMVEGLSLDGNSITDSAMKDLGEFLESYKDIQHLSLSNQREQGITDNGVLILSKYFNPNTSVKHLYLNNHRGIANSSVPILIEMVKGSKLELLDVERTSIDDKNEIRYHLGLNKIRNESSIVHMNSLNLNDSHALGISNYIKEYGRLLTHLE